MADGLNARGMPLRTGVHREMEDAANELLRQQLSGITKHSDKADILTPWKETARKSREVYVSSGTPDASLRRGIFTRSWNSSSHHLNSVEGFAPPKVSNHHDDAPSIKSTWDTE